MNYTPREFPCMDDSPLNNGFGYRDEEEIELNIQPNKEEEIEEDNTHTFSVINRNDNFVSIIPNKY